MLSILGYVTSTLYQGSYFASYSSFGFMRAGTHLYGSNYYCPFCSADMLHEQTVLE